MEKMAKENSSSSGSKSSTSLTDEKNLLNFYKKKYEEFQLKEDKYKEKVDKYLKNLVTDRHELEEEVLRRGEKIADLQKALVELQLSVFEERERFLQVSTENEELKRNEEQLHENIRQLLAMTHQQDLRDKIIYILKNPKVEIRYRKDCPTKSKSTLEDPQNKKLKDELDYLKRQLDEVLQVSKNKSDIVFEDCKQALEKSKMKIMEDDIKIKALQKKLQDAQEKDKTSETVAKTASETVAKTASDASQPAESASPASEIFSKICSHLKDMHLSLILLLKVVTKVNNILNTMQATKLYHRMARIPKVPSDMEYLVEENTILQLETCLRQCTRLTFDISNMYKSLYKYVVLNKNKIQNIAWLKADLKHLEDMLKQMTVITADNDLLNLGLRRSEFFQALRDSSVCISEEDRAHHIEDFRKIVGNSLRLSEIVSKAADCVESLFEKYNVKRDPYDIADSLRGFSNATVDITTSAQDQVASKSDSETVNLKQAKSQSLSDLEKLLGIYKRTVQEAENLGLGRTPETLLLFDKVKAMEKKLQDEEYDELKKCDDNFNKDIMGPEAIDAQTSVSDGRFKRKDIVRVDFKVDVKETETSLPEDVLRKINKTLSKVRLVEEGRYFKDEEIIAKLAGNVEALTKKFQELAQEFNVKSVQDQFSEYSKVTLSKLEELAKQSRNSVIAAEAQIAAHRSNAKDLSAKLKETEELLRESINECLSLKQKVKQSQEEHEKERYAVISKLKERLEKSGAQDIDEVIDDLGLELSAHKGTKIDPFVCMYCRQGSGHKVCEEKMKELSAESRKYKTMLKLFKHDTNEEKMTLKQYREIAEKAASDLGKRNQAMEAALSSLEKRNASLLEQLKVEKNRLKSMERFRKLEMEGFQTDIKMLKEKIKDLEKQLMKAVLIFENNNKDMELLKTVHETAQRSKQAAAALKRLKAKLYELENDIKSL